MEKMFIKPAPGLRVRREDNPRELLPTEGDHVPRTAYWLRRLAEGDVLLADAPIEAATVTKAAVKAASKAANTTSMSRGPHLGPIGEKE